LILLLCKSVTTLQLFNPFDSLQGLALYSSGFSGMMACPQLGPMQMALLILFSQYMRGLAIPLLCKLGR
jgi:hypothetical protein